MEVAYSSKAVEDLESFSAKIRGEIKKSLESLTNDPTGKDNVKLMRVHGRELYRLKISKGRTEKLDHRAVYDIEGDKIRVYMIIDRNEGYDKEEIEERL